MDLTALRVSLQLASLTTVLLLALGVPLAWWLATARARWKVLVEVLVALPLVLPPTVLGWLLLVGFGRTSPLGRVWEALFGHPLVFSFSGLLVASVLSSLPFAVQPFMASMAAVDQTLLDAATVLGASPWRTFRQVVLPLCVPGLVSGGVLAFAHTLGEFGVVLMVGGSIEGETRTLSISLFDAVEQLDSARAAGTALFLLAVSFAVLAVTHTLRRRPGVS